LSFVLRLVGPVETKADMSGGKKVHGMYKPWTKDDWANACCFRRKYCSEKQIHSKKLNLNEENP